MLYTEIITVCTEIHKEHANAFCWNNLEFCNVKLSGTQIKHYALNRLPIRSVQNSKQYKQNSEHYFIYERVTHALKVKSDVTVHHCSLKNLFFTLFPL